MKKFIVITCAVAGLAAIGLVLALRGNETSVGGSAVQPTGRYVALGDSVAAGVGLSDYADSSACDRTTQAYPVRVAEQLQYRLESVACSGATIAAGIAGSQDVNNLVVAPQIDTVLSGDKPKLISVTVGANDAGWTNYLQKCYTAVCGSSADTAQVTVAVGRAMAGLETVLNRIEQKYPASTPPVVVTGYYRLFPGALALNCTEQSGIDASELGWIRQLQDDVDHGLRVAATAHDFVQYVSVDFSGHELCSSSPWIQGLGGQAPYHPTAAGQSAIASQIVTALRAHGGSK